MLCMLCQRQRYHRAISSSQPDCNTADRSCDTRPAVQAIQAAILRVSVRAMAHVPGDWLRLSHPFLGDVGADGLEGPDWGFCPGCCADLGRQGCILHTQYDLIQIFF